MNGYWRILIVLDTLHFNKDLIDVSICATVIVQYIIVVSVEHSVLISLKEQFPPLFWGMYEYVSVCKGMWLQYTSLHFSCLVCKHCFPHSPLAMGL
jgi:hypothetical protein